mmetsp:Transcript_7916/g.12954  ORF Transcript_7916/g.12954 Transcript_7916/m.12954 type:complete len:247 (-) Transcript_7916:147-887(-)
MSSTSGSSTKASTANAHSAKKCPDPNGPDTVSLVSADCMSASLLPAQLQKLSCPSTMPSITAASKSCKVTRSNAASADVDGLCWHSFSRHVEALNEFPSSSSAQASLASMHFPRRSRNAANTSSAHTVQCRRSSGTSGASNCVSKLTLSFCFRRLEGFSTTSGASTVSERCMRSHCTRLKYSSASFGGSSLGGNGPPITGRAIGKTSSSCTSSSLELKSSPSSPSSSDSASSRPSNSGYDLSCFPP